MGRTSSSFPRSAAIATGAVLLLGVACDNTPTFGYLPDAGPQSDAEVPEADAAPTEGTCGLDTPFGPGVPVVFNDREGTILGTSITDAEGSARFEACGPGTSATVIVGSGSSTTKVTIAGLDRDAVALVFPSSDPAPTADVEVTLDTDVSGLDAPAQYELSVTSSSFSDTTPPASKTANDVPLTSDGTVYAIAMARQDTGGPVVGYMAETGITPAASGVTSVSLGPWIAVPTPPELSLDVANPPAGALTVFVQIDAMRSRWSIFGTSVNLAPADVADGGESQVVPIAPAGLADSLLFSLVVPFTDGSIAFSTLKSSVSTSFSIDVAEDVLPHLDGTIVSFPQDDPQRALISWFADGSLDGRDGAEMILRSTKGVWYVLTPDAGAGSFRLPELPSSLEGYAPTLQDHPIIGYASVFDFDWLDFGDVITTKGYSPMTIGINADFVPIPVGGRASVSLSLL